MRRVDARERLPLRPLLRRCKRCDFTTRFHLGKPVGQFLLALRQRSEVRARQHFLPARLPLCRGDLTRLDHGAERLE